MNFQFNAIIYVFHYLEIGRDKNSQNLNISIRFITSSISYSIRFITSSISYSFYLQFYFLYTVNMQIYYPEI